MYLYLSFLRISSDCCSSTGRLWSCHIALSLFFFFILFFRHLVFSGVGWIILIMAGLLRKVVGVMSQTMKVKDPTMLAVLQVNVTEKEMLGECSHVGNSWGLL